MPPADVGRSNPSPVAVTSRPRNRSSSHRTERAAKPSDWKLMGVACGPREVDPKAHSFEEWCAWARGPNKERLEGRGSSPEDALLELTVKLKELGS